jgi:outer membrane protein assembly factor BamB
MINHEKPKSRSAFWKLATPTLATAEGNILVYLVIVLLIFSVLGVTIASLFQTTILSTATPNDSRRAYYMREAGLRYAMSELRSSNFLPADIDRLNTTVFKPFKDQTFSINVFSPWFKSDETKDIPIDSIGTWNIKVSTGKLPSDWVARNPNGLWVVNYEYIDLDLTPSRNPIDSWSQIDDTTLALTLSLDFSAKKGDRLCLAVRPTGIQTINEGDNLFIEEDARHFFPANDGAINIGRFDLVYRRMVHESANSRVRLEGISAASMPNSNSPFPLTVDYTSSGTYSGDFIVLSPRNFIAMATGNSNGVTLEGNLENALNIYDPSTVKPAAANPDIELARLDLNTELSSIDTPDFITVDDTEKNMDIGSNVEGQPDFGAAWYSGNQGTGGKNPICTVGACDFGLGIRAFFTLDYSGTADGLTFSLINADGNTSLSVGGDLNIGELLGYGGDSRLVNNPAVESDFLDGSGNGLRPPKIAIEFDTFTNNDTLNYCSGSSLEFDNRNDPFDSNRDAVHLLFWGFTSLVMPCRDYTLSGTTIVDHPSYDDNRHDSGESSQPWPPYTTGGPVKSTPTVADDGTIYVGSDDGHLYAINPGDGSLEWKFPSFGSIGPVRSQPAVGNAGTIYFGSEDGKIYAVSPAGAELNAFEIQANIPVHSPLVGAGGKVYVGADNSKFYGFDASLNREWEFTAAGPISYGRPALGPNGNIHISHRIEANGRIYSLNPAIRETDPAGALFPVTAEREWEFDVGDGIQFMPGIDQLTGTIYSDRSGNRIVAIKATGTQDWEFNLGTDFDSTPVVGKDGTVYFGADDGKLYAINPVDRKNGVAFPTSREWAFTTGGEVDTTAALAPDGTIVVLSNDDTLYAVNPDGTEKWNFPIPVTPGLPDSSPTIENQGVVYVGSSSDNSLYAINDFAEPRNLKNEVVTSVIDGSDVRVAGEIVTVDDALDWLNGDGSATDPKGPWAIRLEVFRGQSLNANSKYEYQIHAWIRQCGSVVCDNALGTFFADTRIEFLNTPHLFQVAELTPAEHSDFSRFLFGFTGATGTTTKQSAVISDFVLSFIRPNDPTAGD